MYKAVFVLCFVQSALSQCSSRAAVADHADIGYGLRAPWGFERAYGYDGCGCSSAIEYSPTSGGGLPVSSASSIAPIGLSLASENEYKGKLAAAGELPFVGTVGVEGVLPTAGAGAVNHHCGDGFNAMVSDGLRGTYGFHKHHEHDGIVDRGFGFGLEAPALGYRAGWAREGCGCGIY